MKAGLFDRIIQRLRDCAASLPDRRRGKNTRYSMADIALSAFSVFFTQCPSFLSFQRSMQKARGCSNAQSFFQVEHIPTDNHIRHCLDPVEPRHLSGLFEELYQGFDQQGLIEAMVSVNQTQLIALDGTWYFSSQSKTIHCPNCSSIHHTSGETTHYHSALTPVIVSPAHEHVVPLAPEFIVAQDGHKKQDCEINAAKRWLSRYAPEHEGANQTLLGDDLYAHQPFCRQVLLHGLHFLFTCKASSHIHLSRWIDELEEGSEVHTLSQRVKSKSNRWQTHEYRWVHSVPLSDCDEALKVNWCELTITDHEGKVSYHNAWITDWDINAKNVAQMVAAARARWKIENENNNVLKTKGYHLEHNFGHGKEHLSSLLLTMNLLAFGLHTLLSVSQDSYRLIRGSLSTRQMFFEHIRALSHYHCFESWDQMMDFMMRGLEIGPYARAS